MVYPNKLISSGFIILFVALVIPISTHAAERNTDKNTEKKADKKSLGELIQEIRSTTKLRKFKWDNSLFNENGWAIRGNTIQGYPLIYYSCGDSKSSNSSLVLSAVHGDEVAPVYFGFRLVEWLKSHPEICENRFIVVAPIINPDGFLRYSRGTRTNYNKVDLNRNFDTPDWKEKALSLWKKKYRSERRYYPGEKPASEPEVLFQKWLIDEFKPKKIMSVHAPLNMLDYDGPVNGESSEFSKHYVDSCESLKAAIKKATPSLNFFPYGIFPGSLGNYAGKQRGIPTLTVEFPTIDPKDSPFYFGDLEKGTRLFFEYELSSHRITAK